MKMQALGWRCLPAGRDPSGGLLGSLLLMYGMFSLANPTSRKVILWWCCPTMSVDDDVGSSVRLGHVEFSPDGFEMPRLGLPSKMS